MKEKSTSELAKLFNKYEFGTMSKEELFDFFQYLVISGFIDGLQGHYRRVAHELIREGKIKSKEEYVTPIIGGNNEH